MPPLPRRIRLEKLNADAVVTAERGKVVVVYQPRGAKRLREVKQGKPH